MNKKIVPTMVACLLMSVLVTPAALAWYDTGYDYKREVQNTADSSLLLPITPTDVDGSGTTNQYYGQDGYLYYNSETDYEFTNDAEDTQRCGFETTNGNVNCPSPPSGFVSYWTLDESSAEDYISGNDGTLNGGVATGASGQVNGAYDFDGTDDWVDLGTPSDLTLTDSLTYTISGWFKTSDSDTTDYKYIFARTSNGAGYRIFYNFDGVGVLTFKTRNPSSGDNDHIYTDNSYDDGNWHHFTAVRDGDGASNLDIYVDGVDVSTSVSADQTAGTFSNDYPTGIGNTGDGSGGTDASGFFNGKIDDVRIYDRALSSSEISALYDATDPSIQADFGAEQTQTGVAVSTDPATSITTDSATLNGELTTLSGYSSADVKFQYRQTGASTWTNTSIQTLSSTGTFSESISGLNGATEYEFRAVATVTDQEDVGSTLTFNTDATLTTSSGTGGSVTTPGEGSFTYDYGSSATLTASPATGYEFDSWTGDTATITDTTSASTSITMDGDYSVTANFVKKDYTMNVSIVGGGSELNYGEGLHTVTYDETVNLNASEDYGWNFGNWTGYQFSDTSETSFSMPASDITMEATFEREEFNLTVGSSDGGSVTDPGEGTFTYKYEEVVSLAASSDTGYKFNQWTGDTSTISNTSSATTSITMNKTKSITADFNKKSYDLNVSIVGNGSELNYGEGISSVLYNDSVTLEASPDSGWAFANWTGYQYSDTEITSFNMPASDSDMTATFDELQATVVTNNATGVKPNEVTLNGEVTELTYDNITAYFEYRENGTSTWSQSNSTVLNGTGNYSQLVDGLTETVVYEFRAAGDTGEGTIYGSTKTFVKGENEIRLTDSDTGSTIDNFEVQFNNGTDSFGGSTDTGEFLFNTSDVPYGSTNATLKASGYDLRTESYTVDGTFELNQSYTMEAAGFSMQVYDEETEQILQKPKYAHFSGVNDTYEYAWGNQPGKYSDCSPRTTDCTGSETFDEGSVEDIFDGDDSTSAYEDTVSATPGWQFTGEVAVKDGSNTLNLETDVSGDVNVIIEMEKNDGTWQEIYDSNGYVNFLPDSISFNNDGTLTSKVRVDVILDDEDSVRFYEIWANNLEAPQWNYPGPVEGDTTITVEDTTDLYGERQYFADLDEFSKISLDAYLLNQDNSVRQSLLIVDENGEGVMDALITIQKNVGGNWKTVSQKESTGSGTNFFLKSNTEYKVVVTSPNYVTAEETFFPADFDEKTIQLADPTKYDFKTKWDHISYKLEPLGNELPANLTQFNYTVYDSESNLGEIGLNVSYNGTLLNETTVTGSPSGAELTTTANLTNYSFGDEIKATWYFEYNQSVESQTRIYTVNPELEPGDYSIVEQMKNIKSTVGEATVAFIAIFVTMMVATGLGSRLGGLGGGVVTVMTWGFFGYINWVSSYAFMMGLVAAIGLYMVKG